MKYSVVAYEQARVNHWGGYPGAFSFDAYHIGTKVPKYVADIDLKEVESMTFAEATKDTDVFTEQERVTERQRVWLWFKADVTVTPHKKTYEEMDIVVAVVHFKSGESLTLWLDPGDAQQLKEQW
jgi:hypothetical protein